MTTTTPSSGAYPRIRWYDSLILRVAALCVVLIACLFGMVYEITNHYFRGMAKQMTDQVQEMADRVTVQMRDREDAKLDDIAGSISNLYEGTKVDLKPMEDTKEPPSFTVEPGPNGQITKVARRLVEFDNRKCLMTVWVSLVPQTEILHAFKNKYLMALTATFVLTLCMMIYLIARILRPLTDLSATCSRISAGEMHEVEVRKSSGEVQALEFTFNRMVESLREKEKIEANLRQAQRLSAIGNLAAGVAHDIRNPLNAIKLLSSHAIDRLNDVPETASTVRQLQTIRSEVNRLEDIVSSFLSLARERELQPEYTRVDALLDECAHLVRKDAETRGVRMIAELRGGDTQLFVDPKHLARAVLNVLINALEVCPEGGRVRLFSRVTDTTYEIEVRDDGPGMSKEVVERAFEPYFTTKNTGTGLGLSITRGIIEEHGGAVRLSSQEGHGSQVLITLPLQVQMKKHESENPRL